MDRSTGRAIDGLHHLRQSIGDILTTPVGSRVMRRDYGSRLPELIDAPFNRATLIQLYAATALALMRWEKRLILTRVSIAPGGPDGEDLGPGAFTLTLEGRRRDVPARAAATSLFLPFQRSNAGLTFA